MNIIIQTPAPANTRSGNRVTAERWQAILENLGHQVVVTSSYSGADADVLIAIHAWRSAEAIAAFRRAYPGKPIIVCLSGTDIYAYQTSHPAVTRASMEAATVLVGLHDLVGKAIPRRFAAKLHTIYQSVPTRHRAKPRADGFDVCVIGHLRTEKNPFETALAARLLPASSRLHITHVGRAMDENWANDAQAEMAVNPRYLWLGDVPRERVFQLLATSHVMVLSSRMEGGANVIGEALAVGVPVIASNIEGSAGLLGADYPGLYPVGNPAALSALLLRAETEPAFLAQLAAHCRIRAAQFAPERERAAWQQLLATIAPSAA